MIFHQQFSVGQVQRATRGYGFNILGQHRQPVFGSVYRFETEAEAAREAIEQALDKALELTSYP
jgi:hypothetical protein